MYSRTYNISENYAVFWQLDFDDKYQFTKDGVCINSKTGNIIKRVLKDRCVGYRINGKFMSLTKLRKYLIKVKEPKCPF